MKFWMNAPKSDRSLLRWSVACLTASVLLLNVKSRELQAASATQDEEFMRFVDVAAEVYTEIKSKYVEEVDGREVLEAGLTGMFSALDEHSQYMDPKTLNSLNKDTGGSFSGIGIHITQRQGLLTVIAPIPGSPSAKAGLLPWDRIIEINGETTEGMALTDAVEKLTGPSGTEVTIKIFREGEADPLEFTITRASIKIDSVYYHMLKDNVGYMRIAKFSENTASDLRKAMLDLKSQGMEGGILDLRYNTGGLLREAIEVSNLFVAKNEMIVSTKGRLRSQNREYRATEEPIYNLPLFVLVNEGSASASEIVAGALQDHHLCVIIGPAGKNTFGKGSVQTIEPLQHSMYEDENGNPQESALRITTAKYYTPSGRTIHHIGITPDIGVPLPANHERELIRHGLYGDTTIPLTAEEKEAEEKKAKEKETPEGAEGGLVIQSQTPDPEAEKKDSEAKEPAAKDDKAEPFYSKVKKPEVVKEEFTDIMLDEAMKQMKILMILERTRTERNKVAASPSKEAVSMAVPAEPAPATK